MVPSQCYGDISNNTPLGICHTGVDFDQDPMMVQHGCGNGAGKEATGPCAAPGQQKQFETACEGA